MPDYEHIDILVPRERTVDAVQFNVADWTPIALIPGHTNWTGHTRLVVKEAPFLAAGVFFALMNLGPTPCQARCRGYQFDSLGNRVWYDLGSVIHNGPNNVQQLYQDIKTALTNGFNVKPYMYLIIEVKGYGSILLGRLEINWDKPDYGTRIAALEARVAALEAKP